MRAACVEDTPVTPAAHDLVVQAILDPGVPNQYVIVQATTGALSSQTAVAGATVSMTLPNGATVSSAEVSDSNVAQPLSDEPRIAPVYRFSLGQLGVSLVPGGTYRLRVVVPDGRVVTGHTTIPSATPATVASDTTTFDFRHDTLTAAFSAVAGAARYRTEVAFAGGSSLFSMFSDTLVSMRRLRMPKSGGCDDHDVWCSPWCSRTRTEKRLIGSDR
jgi:hypothetical protein